MNKNHFEIILSHYKNVWKVEPNIYLFDKGPFEKLYHDFRVLEFPSTIQHNMWVYSTCCMSSLSDKVPIELHLFSKKKDESLIELLTVVAYYHKNAHKLNLWHTVNFGRGWQDKSACEYGLVSLPYLDGPDLEDLHLTTNEDKHVKFYWLIPVTKQEVDYKKEYGIEALEQLFEEQSFSYLNPNRKSVV